MTRRDSSMFMTRLWLDLKKIRKFLIRLGVKVFAVGLWVAVAPSSARHWNVHFFSLGRYEINADRWLRNIALDVYKICLIFALQWKKQFKTWNTKKCCKRSEKKNSTLSWRLWCNCSVSRKPSCIALCNVFPGRFSLPQWQVSFTNQVLTSLLAYVFHCGNGSQN